MNENIVSLATLDPKSFQRLKKTLKRDHRNDMAFRPLIEAKKPVLIIPHVMQQGAGFQQALKRTLSLANPFHYRTLIRNIFAAFKNKNKMKPVDHEYAKMSQQVYMKPGGRDETVGRWKRLAEHDNVDHAVYQNLPASNYVLALKGTNSLKDLAPDIAIIAGRQDKSAEFKRELEFYRKIQKELPGEWRTTGHSLGGTKAMFLAQKTNTPSHAFNPGFTSLTDDVIDTEYGKHKVYLIKGDPVSNTIMLRKNNELVVLPSEGVRPTTNHTIANFLDE